LAPVAYFTELVETGLWAIWAVQQTAYNQFLPIPARKELFVPKGKDCSSNFRSKHSTVLVLCLLRKLLEQSYSLIVMVLLSILYSVIIFLWSAFASMFFFDHQNSLILDLDKNIPN